MNDKGKPFYFNREEEERKMRRIMQQSDEHRMEEAKNKFENKQDLKEEIKKEIIPTLVQIITKNGIIGTGFFQYSEWLVSNAHIIPAKEVLDAGVQIIDYDSNKLVLDAEASYHRPSNSNMSPDIVVVKTNSRNENHKCLPMQFNADEGFEKSYIFYVDMNCNNPNDFEIKFLHLLSKPNTYPLIYQCEDGREPQPGNSGTPIIEARVILGREPQWQFKVIGALYARCSSNWYNQSKVITRLAAPDTKLVCAIPIKQDLLQILQILHRDKEAVRFQQMANASQRLGDKQGKMDAENYSTMSHESVQVQQLGLKKFEAGESPLNIALPDGLEKLWYKGIVHIECSLLIKKVLTQELGKAASKFKDNVPNILLKDLNQDFNNFIEKIEQVENFKFVKMNDFETSPAGYFRIDVGEKQNNWVLDIQDNTGKDSKGKPYKHDRKSLSSIFAKVTIPKNHSLVSGNQLSKLFLNSQKTREAQDISSLSIVNLTIPSTKKNTKSFSTFDQKQQAINSNYLKDALIKALATIEIDDIEEEILQEVIKASIEEQVGSLKVALQNSANLYSLMCRDVNRDGNCFFHVLSDQLKRYSYAVKSKELKEIAIDHILKNLPIYEPFILDTNTFIDSLLRRDEWADHIIIQAISKALKVTIVIIRSDNQAPNVFRIENAIANLFLGYEVGLHYQSLHPSPSYQEQKIIDLINSNDIDNEIAVSEDTNILEKYIAHLSDNHIEEIKPIVIEEKSTKTTTKQTFRSPLSPPRSIECDIRERKSSLSNTVKPFFPTNEKGQKEEKIEELGNPKVDKNNDKKNLSPPPFF